MSGGFLSVTVIALMVLYTSTAVKYETESIDDTGGWMTGAGLVIGCGPYSSFGRGFFKTA